LEAAPKAPKPGSTNLEVQCLECMRLALNYLKNAQASVSETTNISLAMPTSGLSKLVRSSDQSQQSNNTAESIITNPPSPSKQSSESVEGHDSLSATTASPKSPNSNSQAPPQTAVEKSRAAAIARMTSAERKLSTAITNQAVLHAAEAVLEEDDGDITGGIYNSSSPHRSTSKSCPHCREMMLQSEHLNETVEKLREDITTIANQLEEERAMRDRLQLSKDILDQELEELTAQLFDQANKMVIDEARMREELEIANRDLKGEMKDWAKRCETREDELNELRKNLRALNAAKVRSATSTGNIAPSSSLGSIANLLSAASSSNSNSITPVVNVLPSQLKGPALHAYYSLMSLSVASKISTSYTLPVDGVLFSEFQDHIKQTIMSASLPMAQALTNVHGTPFMKRCLVEDIEPCLFYSYNAHQNNQGGLFSSGKGSNGLLQIKKKVMDGLIKGCIEISSESSSGNGGSIVKIKCAACQTIRECEYQMHISDKPLLSSSPSSSSPQHSSPSAGSPTGQQDQTPLCRFCRDRVVSVVDFYLFIGHLKSGVIGPGSQGVTILGLFRHVQWLRRRMSVSRVSANPLFDIVNLLPHEDWETKTSIS
jgi:hypothetical protein